MIQFSGLILVLFLREGSVPAQLLAYFTSEASKTNGFGYAIDLPERPAHSCAIPTVRQRTLLRLGFEIRMLGLYLQSSHNGRFIADSAFLAPSLGDECLVREVS